MSDTKRFSDADDFVNEATRMARRYVNNALKERREMHAEFNMLAKNDTGDDDTFTLVFRPPDTADDGNQIDELKRGQARLLAQNEQLKARLEHLEKQAKKQPK
jgi:hypothetical protein